MGSLAGVGKWGGTEDERGQFWQGGRRKSGVEPPHSKLAGDQENAGEDGEDAEPLRAGDALAEDGGGVGDGDSSIEGGEDADDADLLELHAAIVKAVSGGIEDSHADNEGTRATNRRGSGLAGDQHHGESGDGADEADDPDGRKRADAWARSGCRQART